MDKRIESVLNYIENNLDLAFNLDNLAKIACLSSSQFHRVFKKETKKTPFQFIEELKMKRAYHAITHFNSKIQKVTLDLGYKDYETFSRAFKRIYKLSPDDLKSIFRKLCNTYEDIQKESVFIASFDTDDENELLEKIKEVMNQLNINQEDLRDSKIFKILKKTSEPVEKHLLIKNKYELIESDKIKESLLK